MENERVKLSLDKAVEYLVDKDRVHTFRQFGHILMGADRSRSEILNLIKKNGVEVAGEQACKMDHCLAVIDEKGFLFLETKKGLNLCEKY